MNLWMRGWRTLFKTQVCDSDRVDCCILAWIYCADHFAGTGGTTAAHTLPQSSSLCREPSHTPTHTHTNATLSSGQPSLSSADACCCVHGGGCSEDVTYQCTLPCFNTEQMNGLHAICLKEEDSTAGGGGGAACEPVVAGGAPWAPQPEPPSSTEESIHVTGGCCHSAARRHLTRCHIQVIKRAYGHCARGQGRHRRCRHVCQALDDGRNHVLGGDLLPA